MCVYSMYEDIKYFVICRTVAIVLLWIQEIWSVEPQKFLKMND